MILSHIIRSFKIDLIHLNMVMVCQKTIYSDMIKYLRDEKEK